MSPLLKIVGYGRENTLPAGLNSPPMLTLSHTRGKLFAKSFVPLVRLTDALNAIDEAVAADRARRGEAHIEIAS